MGTDAQVRRMAAGGIPGRATTNRRRRSETHVQRPIISAKEALDDIRSGLDHAALMRKYNLSVKGLTSLLEKLSAQGLLDVTEIRGGMPVPDQVLSLRNHVTGEVIFRGTAATIKDLVELAVQSGEYLGEADLSGANLSGLEAEGADLSESYLYQANLQRAHLARAKLFRAELSEANLAGAALTGADLSEANLTGADFFQADLVEAVLFRANFDKANLESANLRGSNLRQARFVDAKLIKTDLTGAELSDTEFANADLSSALKSVVKADVADMT